MVIVGSVPFIGWSGWGAGPGATPAPGPACSSGGAQGGGGGLADHVDRGGGVADDGEAGVRDAAAVGAEGQVQQGAATVGQSCEAVGQGGVLGGVAEHSVGGQDQQPGGAGAGQTESG